MKALAILIDPDGKEFYVAYGPHTTDREQATRFLNPEIALKAARRSIFGDPQAFWESERRSAELTRQAHKGWSFRIEEITE